MHVPGNRKKRWGFGPAFFFIISGISPTLAPAYEMFGRFESQFVSEPEPINTTLEDWGKEFDSGRRQWAVAHVEVGVRRSGVEVSLLSRALADLRMNNDAVRFYGKIKRKEPLPEGERVPVSVRVNGFAGTGLRLGYLHRDNNWYLRGGMSLFRTRYLMSGGLDGSFTALAENDYGFEAEVDYVYYRDVIFDRPDVEKSQGLGWSFDLATAWQMTERWSVEVQAEDLFAGIRWEDAPFTEAQANTDNKSYDEDGYAVFSPTISGREGYLDTFRQTLDPRFRAGVNYQIGSWSAHLRSQYQFGYGIVGMGVGHRFLSGVAVQGLIWPGLNALGVTLDYGLLSVSVSADDLEWQNMRAASLAVSYRY